MVAVGEKEHRVRLAAHALGPAGDELWAEIYYQRELKWYKVMARCHVAEQPFWDPPRKRATPAADF
jgi:aminomethyltransferase